MRGRYVALAVMALGAGLAGGVWWERQRMETSMASANAGPEILY
jgi:Cu(I)/Ag(I) efflux system membrane fusion protein